VSVCDLDRGAAEPAPDQLFCEITVRVDKRIVDDGLLVAPIVFTPTMDLTEEVRTVAGKPDLNRRHIVAAILNSDDFCVCVGAEPF
jgi:hypothetical protein